jgi:uncharacterized protein (DUF58 family)
VDNLGSFPTSTSVSLSTMSVMALRGHNVFFVFALFFLFIYSLSRTRGAQLFFQHERLKYGSILHGEAIHIVRIVFL